MKVLVIDGQGGGIGKAIVLRLQRESPEVQVIALGTNSVATSAMLRAGADAGATGENAIVVNCARADVIVGAIGIVLANAMLGEITPAMAAAIGGSGARRILIPVERCNTHIAGVGPQTLDDAIGEVASMVAQMK
jgi:NAD(P)-dependent dehydrogenase (short-subunit alcohol dehydrogenase family)